jgi:hypothetical protein
MSELLAHRRRLVTCAVALERGAEGSPAMAFDDDGIRTIDRAGDLTVVSSGPTRRGTR